jgi:hypothetical protein
MDEDIRARYACGYKRRAIGTQAARNDRESTRKYGVYARKHAAVRLAIDGQQLDSKARMSSCYNYR